MSYEMTHFSPHCLQGEEGAKPSGTGNHGITKSDIVFESITGMHVKMLTYAWAKIIGLIGILYQPLDRSRGIAT